MMEAATQTKAESSTDSESLMELAELQRHYSESDSVDKDIFSEQRSNILLIAGEHYTRAGSKFWNRLRDSKEVAQEQKIRLTKNHIYKIMRSYSNTIVSLSPFVTCEPCDEKSLSDQKSAELHNHVLSWAKKRYRLKEKVRSWCDDFTGIGEVACKIFFDPNLGKPVAEEQLLDEDGGPVLDEMGQPQSSGKIIFSGDFVFEEIYGFNLLREAKAKNMQESAHITLRKMVDTKEYQNRYAGDPEKKKCFQDSVDGTYIVFDTSRTAYGRSRDQCMVMETYYRPSTKYPEGYYYFWTNQGIFEQGKLPLGLFPIVFAPFDKFQTSPRGRSHIKVLRPFQAEVNRSASKMAEHQITLGDDKIITQIGTKITQGGSLPGVRGITVQGPAPQILPGRDGSQYMNYMQSNISEMYSASLIAEEEAEVSSQMDPYSLLFMAASQKKKFSVYTERFEQFLVDVFTLFFALARQYLSDADLEEAVGKNELMNLDEFRNHPGRDYTIQVESQSDDIETKMGRQLVMNHFIQFAGGQLDKEDLGQLMRTSPYANNEQTFEQLTSNYDAGTNCILAMDKGKQPVMHSYDDHPYFVKRYLARMRKPDFDLLPPQVQQLYQSVVTAHEQAEAQRIQQIKQAESEFIPTGGAMITCDLYVPDAKNPESSKRARLPYEALDWLIKQLDSQGSTQQMLQQLPEQAQSDILRQSVAPRTANPQLSPQNQPAPQMAAMRH